MQKIALILLGLFTLTTINIGYAEQKLVPFTDFTTVASFGKSICYSRTAASGKKNTKYCYDILKLKNSVAASCKKKGLTNIVAIPALPISLHELPFGMFNGAVAFSGSTWCANDLAVLNIDAIRWYRPTYRNVTDASDNKKVRVVDAKKNGDVFAAFTTLKAYGSEPHDSPVEVVLLCPSCSEEYRRISQQPYYIVRLRDRVAPSCDKKEGLTNTVLMDIRNYKKLFVVGSALATPVAFTGRRMSCEPLNDGTQLPLVEVTAFYKMR